ncbi:MAG: phosphatase family protein [Chitinophagaceae bacterium]|nr:phosphatase family protein [Chitinophagaceae bacterium]
MKKLLFSALLVLGVMNVEAQDTTYAVDSNISVVQAPVVKYSSYAADTKRPSPYTTSFKKDGWAIIGLLGLNAGGLYLVQKKKDLTMDQLATKTRDNVPFFDRGNVGYFDESIDKDSYIPFYASFAWPMAMILVDGDQTRNFGQVLTLYLETMAVTGAMFTITAGAINRSRPLVYGSQTPIGRRLSKNSQRSFYAGHTAATAASSFFTAKVFADMNPDSKLKPVIWTIAAALPAIVGYQRWKSGQHFLSDNILGYGLGAATGILIPHWHKTRKSDKLTIMPEAGPRYQGVAMVYKF